MFKIVEKKLLAPDIWMINVEAPRVAKAANPGQFVIVRVCEGGERVPLTIADYDSEKGTVMMVVQSVGASTRKMAAMEVGESLPDLAGPLGQPSEFIHESPGALKDKKILFIAGGVGAAPVYPQVKWLHERGIEADVIIGARCRDFLLMVDEMKAVAGNVFLCTDDGSEGFHGNVTAMFRELAGNRGMKYDEVITIGPMIMMKFVAQTTKEYGIKTVASLNTLMIDGTGMCGACRVTVGDKTRFTCVDGPEFNAHLVDFDEAMRRQTMYKGHEQEADHKCRVGVGK